MTTETLEQKIALSTDIVGKCIQNKSTIKNICNRTYKMNMQSCTGFSETDVYSQLSWFLLDDVQ